MTLSLEAKGLLTELLSGQYQRINAESIQIVHPEIGINRIRRSLAELRNAGFVVYNRVRIGSSWSMSIELTKESPDLCKSSIGMVPSGSRQSWDSLPITSSVKVPEPAISGSRQSWDSSLRDNSDTYHINIGLRPSVRYAHTKESNMPSKWNPNEDFDGMVFGRSDEDARPPAKARREKKSRRHRQDRPQAEWNNLDLTYEFRDRLREKRPLNSTFAITAFAAMLKHLRVDAQVSVDEVLSLMGQFFDNNSHYTPGITPDAVAKNFINFARKNLTRLRSLKVADSDAHYNDPVSQESVRNFYAAAERMMKEIAEDERKREALREQRKREGQ